MLFSFLGMSTVDVYSLIHLFTQNIFLLIVSTCLALNTILKFPIVIRRWMCKWAIILQGASPRMDAGMIQRDPSRSLGRSREGL